MSDLIVVTGEDCLDYIDKKIGLASHDFSFYGAESPDTISDTDFGYTVAGWRNDREALRCVNTYLNTSIYKWSHDVSKRKVGLVLGDSPDGGLIVAILGDERLRIAPEASSGNVKTVNLKLRSLYLFEYRMPTPFDDYELETKLMGFPEYNNESNWTNAPQFLASVNADAPIGYDNILEFNINDYFTDSYQITFGAVCKYAGNLTESNHSYLLTNDKNNTLVYGTLIDFSNTTNGIIKYPVDCVGNPLSHSGGNLYDYGTYINNIIYFSVPQNIKQNTPFSTLSYNVNEEMNSYTESNLSSIPFNLILTRSEFYAKEYLENGVLPPDAFLYPLDWENMPEYDKPVPTGDKPDDFPDDNDPGDDGRDFDPTPPETPSYTVNQLTNYNWYWLTVPEWSAFISWFWNDIGDYSDFDDIIAKVKGLYNDVASAVIMCRYYPVDISWIGGLGTQSNIKLGMIEKSGAVDTISQATSLHAVDIGHVHIGTKYKSFMDMSPYSQLSLYLPWHGFIDLDMNLFNGHDVYVKALYDYLSGTIQYYIYYDNELLVNTILCKMAMDIPITLQTKSDRDSAIFNNVSSTIGGLVGAGVGIASGNPIGMALGVTQGVGAFNNANASAPMRLMGNVGESGAYIGCQNCFVIVRRPTIQPSDGNSNTMKGLSTWKKNVGMLCGYGYTLSDLSGQGFTVCHSPRIDFKSTTPLQTEVDKIYDYLEKGVIL